jgi:Dehydrogenase E1 component
MPTTKPARVPRTAKPTKRFSLVSAAAQQEMYQALSTLKSSRAATASGAWIAREAAGEVAEIAVCLAAGEQSPLILACRARGARTVRKGCKVVGAGGPHLPRRLAAATLAAIAALLADAEANAAVVCAGKLDPQPEAQQDYRAAFRFAARHKLPILFLVANGFAPGQRQQLDLRTLSHEFGIPLFSVDASDAIAAYRVATEALHNARHLRGPCVIEALMLDHSDSGAPTPLDLLAAYMERHGNRPR